MSLIRTALRAASKILGAGDDPNAPPVPADIARQRARAAKAAAADEARGRRRSRMSRAWAVIRAGFVAEHGHLDPGQRHALRGRVRQALRRRRSRLVGDCRPTRGPKSGPSGACRRRTRQARLANHALEGMVSSAEPAAESPAS